MMEILLNLLLTGMFLDSQAKSQATLDSVKMEYQLPEAEARKLAETAPAEKADSSSVGVKVTAESVLVLDQDSRKILYEKNSGQARSIASLTKLMTALVFLDHNPGWEKEIAVSSADYRPGGQAQLIAGEKTTVRDVFFTMLVGSANEAAAALARSTRLSEEDFVFQMNAKAEALGMSGAVFKDVTGLDPENQASAVDVMFLAQAAFDKPEIVSAASLKQYEINILNKKTTRRILNTDKILGQDLGTEDSSYRVRAGKTGYLEKAGYCFASQIENRKGRSILTVVLGSASANDRFNDTKSLAYWVFDHYLWP